MKTTLLILIVAALSLSCSNDDKVQKECKGRFINDITGITMIQTTDCNCEGANAPEGHSFVECIDGPSY